MTNINAELTTWSDIYAQASQSLNINITSSQQNKIQQYYDLLVKTNETLNLTRLTSMHDFGYYHLLDTCTIIHALSAAGIDQSQISQYLDIGTGCGVPGLLMHILIDSSSLHTTLLDSLQKRINYLSDTIKALSLNKIQATHNKAETYIRGHQKHYHLITARACAKPIPALSLVQPYLSPRGIYVAQTTHDLSTDDDYQKALTKYRLQIKYNHEYILAGKVRYIALISY
jgi:16S rRNA (guanine527-N7)-methyltransferase